MPAGLFGSPLCSSWQVRCCGAGGGGPTFVVVFVWQPTLSAAAASRAYRERKRIADSRRSVWAGREAGGMPRGKSCERRRLDSPARSRLSPAEDRGARRSSQQALLLVVELDVRLVQQRDGEVEREVAVWALEEREARVPAMQVAVQGDHVLAELAGVEVVRRRPPRGPVRGRAERQVEAHRLAPSRPPHEGNRGRERVGPRARARQRKGDGEVESLARARSPDRDGTRADEALLPEGAALSGRVDSRRPGRGGGRGPGGSPAAGSESEQAPDPGDRRRRDGERRGEICEERVELRRVDARLTAPQVVGQAQAESRQQVRGEGVVDRLGLPPGATGVLRLLEVVGERARVDAEQPELAGRALRRGVAGRRLELRLEVLRQAEADRKSTRLNSSH